MGSSNSSQTSQNYNQSNAAYNYGQTTQPSQILQETGTSALENAWQLQNNPFQIPVAPVAGFNPTERSAFNATSALPSAITPTFQQAAGLVNRGADISASGAAFQGPGAANAFYNAEAAGVIPELENQYAEQASANTGNLTQTAGGVGAGRIAVGQGELQRQQALAEGATLSSIYGQAVNQAQQAGLNLNTIGSGVAGEGGTLAGVGATGTSSELAALQAQLSTGELQQAQTQAELNAPYQNILQRIAWPYQTTQFGAGIEAGLGPLMGSTTTGTGTASGTNIGGSYTQASQTPSVLSQLGQLGGATSGIGTAAGGGYGIFGSGGLLTSLLPFAKGGRVKGYADGGAVGGPMAAHALNSPRPIQVNPMQWAGQRMAPGGTVWTDMEPPGLAEQLEHLKRKYADGGDIGGAAGIPAFGITSIPNMLKKPMPGAGGGIGMSEMPQTHAMAAPDPGHMRAEALGSLPKPPAAPQMHQPTEGGSTGASPAMDIAKAAAAPMQAFNQAQQAFSGLGTSPSWQPGGANFESPDVAGGLGEDWGVPAGGFAHGGAVGYDDGGLIDDMTYLGSPDSAATYIDATPPVPPPQADWSWGGGGQAGAAVPPPQADWSWGGGGQAGAAVPMETPTPMDSSGAGWGMRSRHVPELPPDMSGSPFNAAGVAGMVGTPSGHIQTHLPPVMGAQPFNAAGVSGLAGTPSGPSPAAPSPMAPPGNINIPGDTGFSPESAFSVPKSTPEFGTGNSPVNYVPETAEQTGNPLAAPSVPSVGSPTVAGTPHEQRPGMGRGDLSSILETGHPLADNRSLATISPDAHHSKSYGPWQLNSWSGSMQHFTQMYGGALGLTAPVGSSEFDKQFREASARNPEGMRDAMSSYYEQEIAPRAVKTLQAYGVNPQFQHDGRVIAFMSDRYLQMGTVGLGNALQAARGAKSPEEFIHAVRQADDQNLGRNFGTYLSENPQNARGLYNRNAGRERMALQADPASGELQLTSAHEEVPAGTPSSPVEAQAGRGAAATPMEPRGLQVAQAGPMARPQQGNPITRFGDALGNFAARVNPDWGMKNLQLDQMRMSMPLFQAGTEQALKQLQQNNSGTVQEDLDHLDRATKILGGHDQDDVQPASAGNKPATAATTGADVFAQGKGFNSAAEYGRSLDHQIAGLTQQYQQLSAQALNPWLKPRAEMQARGIAAQLTDLRQQRQNLQAEMSKGLAQRHDTPREIINPKTLAPEYQIGPQTLAGQTEEPREPADPNEPAWMHSDPGQFTRVHGAAKLGVGVEEGHKDLVKRDSHVDETRTANQQNYERMRDMRRLLDEGLKTGLTAEGKAKLGQYAKDFGITPPKSLDPVPFQEFAKNVQAAILPSVKSQVEGTGSKIMMNELQTQGKAGAQTSIDTQSNRHIIAQTMGMMDWQNQYLQDYVDWRHRYPNAHQGSNFDEDWNNDPRNKIAVFTELAEGHKVSPDLLVKGRLYRLPGGEFRWAGNGWARP